MRPGPYGTLQSIADTIKLIAKEDLRPATADRWVFELAPIVTFVPAFAVLVALPFTDSLGGPGGAGLLDLGGVVEAQGRVPFIVWQPLGFFIFMTGMLAETSRRPFDIPSAESAIVGGPWVEYSGRRWGIIFAFTEDSSMLG